MANQPALPGKLIRDRIPAVIERHGSSPIVEVVCGETYLRYLEAKLGEEVDEFRASREVVELADIVEVCFAAAAALGYGVDDLLRIAHEKREDRGGFTDRLIWLGNR
ncbi:nucleoside triphosphate pyrophosphohydrolase [Micromonospora mirobrigensis]|uniref:Predicted house-cleaning noncanonical NTP pyrophosphatase, all-alpha NTP-PPase (MazG) superfamily n=1 Tax=Micromonospora mirobrigensis TaxID=262898 RepID=A0A1C4Z0F8_9ACTN|nr:nucleoside triphosphate pyrophosphohydrolase [Micromonospora mirobrigensis]SCF26071.1 Predicted house-cleaning noncanonical NTP pyrophosphatase, all-alpha NTP-PPase (MazG) superfamily [Micromonospora mirobrigensis]